jgi:hypothetical protein
MITHACPVCHQRHEVNAIQAVFAYGNQITCSPHCESERRRRMRLRPAEEPRSPVLHAWVVNRTNADLVRANSILHPASASFGR